MGKYIHFTEEQKRQAGAVDLEEFLRTRGEQLIASGREKRLVADHSITVRGSEWYDHATQKGGGPVSFVQTYYGVSYPEAMQMLLGGNEGAPFPPVKQPEQEMPKEFHLPDANNDMRRVYGYLMHQRKISREVISCFAREGTLYEDARYHNCVFVGRDEENVARHAHKRSTNSYATAYRANQEGSDPRYSFHHAGSDGQLYVFEAPIDLLSFLTLFPENWQVHSYVACCGTSIRPVLHMLERLPGIDTVYLCLDNDEAGHKACQRMEGQLAQQNVSTERLVSTQKDWNADLVAYVQTREVKEPCRTMC